MYKSVYVQLQRIKIPFLKIFVRVQNRNIYLVLLEGIMRPCLNCPLIYEGHDEE